MFTDPHWLILLIPAAVSLRWFPDISRRVIVLRAMILFLIIMALAGFQLRLESQDGIVVVVADRSLSMPAGSESRIAEMVNLLKKDMPDNAKMGLISFADNPIVEMTPSRNAFAGFSGEINPEASNLYEALSRAISIIPAEQAARILLISDGLYSGRDPQHAAFKSAARGIPVDYRLLSREAGADMVIKNLTVPGLINTGESFVISAEIFSPEPQKAHIQLKCSGSVIGNLTRDLRKGTNYLVFRHSASSAMIYQYELTVKGEKPDPVPENNRAIALCEVAGQKPVLIISQSPESSMNNLLKGAGLKTSVHGSGSINWSVEFLAGYSAVILENVPADRIGQHGMRVLDAWVKQLGGGLMMTGGKQSFGTGGYYQSPLEAALPVSLELRSEHRKLALALMVVLDRSGSMAAPARGDRTKMDLANIAAASSMELLSSLDEFGVLAVDTEAHVVVPLGKLTDKGAWRDKILRIESMGGGIYVHEGLSKACEMLLKASALTRHIILFADAADAEQPGRYWELLEKAGKAGITVSVIGLGTETDSDANLLRKVAVAGNGRIFFTRDPEELPRLFTQDTFVAARSTFIEELAPIALRPDISLFTGSRTTLKSSVNAYNLCYAKPGTIVAAITTDDNNAPLLAAWQYGLGRAACYTGVLGASSAGEFISLSAGAEAVSSVCKWLISDMRQTIAGLPVTQKIEKGRWQAVLHLDPEREREMFNTSPVVTVIRSFSDRDPEKEDLTMAWDSADTLSAEMPLIGNEALVALVDAGPIGRARLHPVTMPYSHEFAIHAQNEGSRTMQALAAISGGGEIIDLSEIWRKMPPKIQFRSLSELLLVLALCLFLLEVAERRLSLVSIAISLIRRNKEAGKKLPAAEKIISVSSVVSSSENQVASISENSDQIETSLPAQSQSDVLNALKKARKQADKRNR